ncbi:hypothetical protein ABH925_005533 [Streptacidiphilus sp. EB129]
MTVRVRTKALPRRNSPGKGAFLDNPYSADQRS